MELFLAILDFLSVACPVLAPIVVPIVRWLRKPGPERLDLESLNVTLEIDDAKPIILVQKERFGENYQFEVPVEQEDRWDFLLVLLAISIALSLTYFLNKIF